MRMRSRTRKKTNRCHPFLKESDEIPEELADLVPKYRAMLVEMAVEQDDEVSAHASSRGKPAHLRNESSTQRASSEVLSRISSWTLAKMSVVRPFSVRVFFELIKGCTFSGNPPFSSFKRGYGLSGSGTASAERMSECSWFCLRKTESQRSA